MGYGVYGYDAILILSEKTIIAPVDCSEMFAYGDNELFGFCEMINFANFDTSNTTNMANMFVGVGINLDDYLECCICQNFNTEKVTNMSYMFSCCTFMPTLNISSFTISDSCDIDAMLDDCTSLEKVYVGEEMYLNQTWRKKTALSDSAQILVAGIDYSSFNTPIYIDLLSLTATPSAFLSITFDYYDTPGNYTNDSGERVVRDYKGYSYPDTPDEMPLSKLENSAIFNFGEEERNCFFKGQLPDLYVTFKNGLKNGEIYILSESPIYITATDEIVSADDYTNGMFYAYNGLNSIILRNFNTSCLKTMCGMFAELGKVIELDISELDVSNVTNIEGMFYDNLYLGVIYVGDKWNLDESKLRYSLEATIPFRNNYYLEGGAGTRFDDIKDSDNTATGEYARIDGKGGPGLFTRKNT